MCGQRPRGKLASIYWSAWINDGERDAWKQKYDKTHYEDACADWLDAARASFDAEGALSCLLCDAQDRNELVQLYATAFVPSADPWRITITACLKHFPEILRKAKVGAEVLPDRSMYMNGGLREKGW
jgi:hypothetical protein